MRGFDEKVFGGRLCGDVDDHSLRLVGRWPKCGLHRTNRRRRVIAHEVYESRPDVEILWIEGRTMPNKRRQQLGIAIRDQGSRCPKQSSVQVHNVSQRWRGNKFD